MEKRGRIETGLTPSEISGKPSDLVKEGQVLTKDEAPDKSSIEKVAALME